MTGAETTGGVRLVTAPNPSPMTLDGTNSYVVDGWVVDPGPLIESHVEAILGALEEDMAGVVLTHGHSDHAEAADEVARRGGGVKVVLPVDGQSVGPFEAMATPGHSSDHVALIHRRSGFVGDTVLGFGSVFIQPGDGALASYLASLDRLLALDLELLFPGHGPIVTDPNAKLREYIDHRLERERLLVAALESGARTRDELLDAAWSDAPPMLRPAAAATLAAHAEKLRDEGRLPGDVPDDVLAMPF